MFYNEIIEETKKPHFRKPSNKVVLFLADDFWKNMGFRRLHRICRCFQVMDKSFLSIQSNIQTAQKVKTTSLNTICSVCLLIYCCILWFWQTLSEFYAVCIMGSGLVYDLCLCRNRFRLFANSEIIV
jgi:hypothetical protein